MDLLSAGRGLLGIAAILAVAFAFSSDRRGINLRTVGVGLLLQLFFAVLVLKGDVLGGSSRRSAGRPQRSRGSRASSWSSSAT